MSDNDQNIQVSSATASGQDKGGFFTIHRRGQGKWTRLGTAGGTALIILGTAAFLTTEVRANMGWTPKTGAIVAAVVVLLMTLLAFFLQNKPSNVAFLIDTDSEMKKVNWTSKKELIGSTKIVIGFMVLMGAGLFVIDIVFGYFFYLINVLKFSPFGGSK